MRSLQTAGDLHRAAAKGRATTPKGTPMAKSYTLTKARTALRKAAGDKAARKKIHKAAARHMLGHSKLMRQKSRKLP